jgi:ubiquinone/menaquinone biosynthesis C-methylase UbiE
MLDRDRQRDHYDRMMADKIQTVGVSCGYDDRFDPFLLDRRPELLVEFNDLFTRAFPEPAGNLLDLGCGSGLYFPALVDRADEITGVDISSGMIDAAQELVTVKGYNNVKVKVGTSSSLDFPDESFNSVLAFDVLHHVEDIDQTMKEINRVLKPGGKFVSVEPNVLNPIVFMVHLIPEEERGAIVRNYPWFIKNLLEKHIGTAKSQYINHVTAPNSNMMLTGIKVLKFFTSIWPLSYFTIRMLWTATKV